MGVRFRKTVSLGKRARVNFSKSGPSLGVGKRGSSMSFGKRGAFVNLGIPGTGLAVSNKIPGGGKTKSKAAPKPFATKNPANNKKSIGRIALEKRALPDGTLPLSVGVDEIGEIFFVFTDTGEIIDDVNILKELRKLPEIKQALLSLRDEQKSVWGSIEMEAEEATRNFIEIYKASPKLLTRKEFQDRLESLQPKKYFKNQFTKEKPTKDYVKQLLYRRAEASIKGIFGRRKKFEEYVTNNYEQTYASLIEEWQKSVKFLKLKKAVKSQS